MAEGAGNRAQKGGTEPLRGVVAGQRRKRVETKRNKFLKELGIDEIIDLEENLDEDVETTKQGISVIQINDSEDFGKVMSKLDNSDLVRQDDESSNISEDSISIQYASKEFLITLLGDLDGDTYRMTIKELNESLFYNT